MRTVDTAPIALLCGLLAGCNWPRVGGGVVEPEIAASAIQNPQLPEDELPINDEIYTEAMLLVKNTFKRPDAVQIGKKGTVETIGSSPPEWRVEGDVTLINSMPKSPAILMGVPLGQICTRAHRFSSMNHPPENSDLTNTRTIL